MDKQELGKAISEIIESNRNYKATEKILELFEAHSPQWVKVSDSKKPEWNEAVLTVDGYGYMTVCGYDQTIGFYPKLSGDHPNWDNTILTHWMPLPHPPKDIDNG